MVLLFLSLNLRKGGNSSFPPPSPQGGPDLYLVLVTVEPFRVGPKEITELLGIPSLFMKV